MKYWIVITCALLASCSSKKLKYDKDDEIEVKATVGTATEIGLNTDEEPIIQENVPVEDELRTLSWKNYEHERKLKAEREDLIRCRTELADPRLSGDKKLDDIPELDLAADTTKVQEKLGITEAGRIKVIRKENLKDRLEKESRYRDSLVSLLSTLTRHQENCNRELGYKRVQHGLPAHRYPALGYYGAEGNYIVTRQAEKSLDDAFQILAQQTLAGKKQERAEAAEAAKLAVPMQEEVVEETPLPTGT